jgi:putative FmdB family regulatory protein
MPIIEYRCETCEKTFEELVADPRKATVPCAHCGAKEVVRLFSTFAAGNGASSQGSSPNGAARSLGKRRESPWSGSSGCCGGGCACH